MLDAVVRSLGTVLDTEDLERVRKAYTIATAYVEVHEIEFSHMQPRRLRTTRPFSVDTIARKPSHLTSKL